MADTLEQFACHLKPRWKEHEILMARSLDYKIDDYQLEQDWSNIISLANQPGYYYYYYSYIIVPVSSHV